MHVLEERVVSVVSGSEATEGAPLHEARKHLEA